jgi:hypothetical protein
MPDLTAIRRRVEQATSGPWQRHGADVHAGGQPLLRGRDGTGEARAQADRDAEFVAHARQDVLDLLELIDGADEMRAAE